MELRQLPQLEGLRALVADDDTDTCLSVSTMLSKIGMRPEWTISGREAVIRTRYAMEQGDEFSVYIIDWLDPRYERHRDCAADPQGDRQKLPHHHLTAYDWADIREDAALPVLPPSAKSRCSSRSCAECWQSRSVQSLPAGRCS